MQQPSAAFSAPRVVITGASRGVGKATALALAQRGASLVLVGRSSAAMDDAIARCRAFGTDCRLVPCELADPIAVEKAGAAIDAMGPTHVLINNAGVAERATLGEMTLEGYTRQMNTNLLAPIWLTRALLPGMLQRRRGRILNVGSISSTLGTAGQIAYNASKWGLVGFTKSLAAELTDTGLMAAALLPGSVDTDMLKGSPFPARMSAEDVASTLVFYALDAPLAHNGASIEMFGI